MLRRVLIAVLLAGVFAAPAGASSQTLIPSADDASRTYKFCSVYDNGAGDPSEVKRQSTSLLSESEKTDISPSTILPPTSKPRKNI